MTVSGNYMQYRYILQDILINLSKIDGIWKIYLLPTYRRKP
jgi:hypothetical protein